MTTGTKSLLFGAHCFFLHPFFVAWGWWRLFGFPWDPRLWCCFLFHDIGYWGMSSVEGPGSERHVEFGARMVGLLCGDTFADECRRHSRQWCLRNGSPISRLCLADKMAFALMPAWLYLPMARRSGELAEYMARSVERECQEPRGLTPNESAGLASGDPPTWLHALQSYTSRWVLRVQAGIQ